MVEDWVKQAQSAARAGGRRLLPADVLAQVLPRDDRSPEDIRTIALHEIGHAIVAYRLGLGVDRVSIVAQGDSGGHTRTRLPSVVPTWEHLCNLVTISLAGRAADMVLGTGANTGAVSDLANATTMLLAAFERQGLGQDLAYMPVLGIRRAGTTAAVEGQLARLLTHAVDIIEADRGPALFLSERLISERILSGEDIARVLPKRSAAPRTLRNKTASAGVKGAGKPSAADTVEQASSWIDEPPEDVPAVILPPRGQEDGS